jgi:putative ABC transport system permease protein
VLVIERPGIAPRDRQVFNSAIDVFRDELKKDPSVQAASTSITVPGKQREYKASVKKYGATDDQHVTIRINSMDYDFVDVFKMKLIAGRLFAPDYTQDQDTSIILTESAVRLLGFMKPDDAVGQTLAIEQFQWNPIIVGVVNDYHQVSLKKSLDPTGFFCTLYGGEYYSMRIGTNDLGSTLDHVRQAWLKAFPGNPFEYFFLDDYFNQQYENEQKFGKLFTTFSVLAIIIGCLGLFGLSAYTATQRTKEIGIRKVLGSSVGGIFLLLSQEYIKLVFLAILLAIPIVWFVMHDWIQGFPYHTTISGVTFLIAGSVVLLISMSTVTVQTLKAARSNPVDSLRYE